MSALPYLIEARGLQLVRPGRAGRAPLCVLDGVSLGVRPGEVVALVGESGAGKSTLVRALLGLERGVRGSVLWRGGSGEAGPASATGGPGAPGVDLLALRGRALRAVRARAQVVFQDPLASLDPRWSARAALGEALRLRAATAREPLARAELERRALALLERVGLAREHLVRLPHELSGGERARLCLARALALEPRFLALDEPVAALDASVQAQVLELLADLRRERGLAYLLVTHDLALAEWMADRVAVLAAGRVVEEGPAAEVLAAPRQEPTRVLVAARAVLERPAAVAG